MEMSRRQALIQHCIYLQCMLTCIALHIFVEFIASTYLIVQRVYSILMPVLCVLHTLRNQMSMQQTLYIIEYLLHTYDCVWCYLYIYVLRVCVYIRINNTAGCMEALYNQPQRTKLMGFTPIIKCSWLHCIDYIHR